jgi:hypothetical protein
MKLSTQHRRALDLLAGNAHGLTEALLIDVHGFALQTIVD